MVRKRSDHDFGFSHDLPEDFLRPWYLAEFGRFSLESKIEVGGDETRLFTDCEDTVLYYAKRVINTVRWPPAMTQAVVYGLAYKVCEPLTGKDTLVDRLLTLANGYLSSAQSVSVNYGSEARILDSDPDWIQARSSGIRICRSLLLPTRGALVQCLLSLQNSPSPPVNSPRSFTDAVTWKASDLAFREGLNVLVDWRGGLRTRPGTLMHEPLFEDIANPWRHACPLSASTQTRKIITSLSGSIRDSTSFKKGNICIHSQPRLGAPVC